MNYSRHYRRPTYFSWGNVRDIFFSKTTYVLNYLCSIHHREYQKKRPKKSEKLMQINCLAGFFLHQYIMENRFIFHQRLPIFFSCTIALPQCSCLHYLCTLDTKKSGGIFFLWFITVFFIFLIFQFLNKGLSKKVYNRCRSWSLKE